MINGQQRCEEWRFDEYFLKSEGPYSYIYSDDDYVRHNHTDFCELTLVTAGSFINEYGGKRRRFARNSLLFHRVGEQHQITCGEQDSSQLSFIVKQDHFEAFCKQHFPHNPEILSTRYQEHHLAHKQTDYIVSAFHDIDLTPKQDHLALLDLLLFTLLHYCFLRTPLINDVSEKRDIHWYIKEMLYHFDRFEYVQMSVEDIYRDYPLSPSAMAHQFKKETGYTIVQYRHIKRMEYAAQMLTTSNRSVTEVAALIGYNSMSYFSKKFKEHFGRLPSEYHPRTLNINRYHKRTGSSQQALSASQAAEENE